MADAATPLSRTTCLIHVDRPATARCPGCGTFYCGECITEHDGKLTCARCLSTERELPEETASRLSLPVMPVVHLAIAIVVCWGTFYAMAQTLASLPDQFHDGTIWESAPSAENEGEAETGGGADE
ncbi:MAG: rhomboid family protein [Verrucomicrobiales bacterium]|nr:rhomboid family protein [Verrucomicrobiales bacterium]